jgi:hypothetical protein
LNFFAVQPVLGKASGLDLLVIGGWRLGRVFLVDPGDALAQVRELFLKVAHASCDASSHSDEQRAQRRAALFQLRRNAHGFVGAHKIRQALFIARDFGFQAAICDSSSRARSCRFSASSDSDAWRVLGYWLIGGWGLAP